MAAPTTPSTAISPKPNGMTGLAKEIYFWFRSCREVLERGLH